MTTIRRNRRTLDESMETAQPIRDFDHLMELIREYEPHVTPEMVHVRKYGGPDNRIGWPATYLIEVEGRIPWGMADGPIPRKDAASSQAEWAIEQYTWTKEGGAKKVTP